MAVFFLESQSCKSKALKPLFVPGLRERARKDSKRLRGRHPFFSPSQRKRAPFSAEPLRPCCDSCGEKIYIPILKQL